MQSDLALHSRLFYLYSSRLIDCNGVQRRFNSYGHTMAVGDAHVFPGFLTTVLTQLPFESHPLLFSHASAKMRGGENGPERKFASNVYRTHNHQVMSPTRSPPSYPSGALYSLDHLTLSQTTNSRLSQIERVCR